MRFILILTFILTVNILASADEDIIVVSPGKKAAGVGTETFSDKVKTIRIADGEWEVFFEKKGGPFSIPGERDNTGALQQACKASYEKKIVLSATVDKDNDILVNASVDQLAQATAQSEQAKKPAAAEYNIDAELDKAIKGIKGK